MGTARGAQSGRDQEAGRLSLSFAAAPIAIPRGHGLPQMQIDMFPRSGAVDADHDLPEAFLPEFPPAMFLSNRPELGDVSRGEVISINNYYRLFKDILTPVQLDGLQDVIDAVSTGRVQPHR